MKVHVHYEAAFEDLLRCRQIPYVSVDEARKAIFRDAKLKSFDFIVYSESRPNWLVDIKGRRFAARKGSPRAAWENWITQADLDGLRQWQQVFGDGFAALIVFAYWLDGPGAPPAELVHTFRDRQYVFAALPLSDYEQHARVRSPKWGTVNMPVRRFAERIRPLAQWL
jgi:hypothetical protein